MSRPVLTRGTVPSRETLQGRLRWLKADAATARRVFERYHDHHSELRMHYAEQAVDDFIEQHPGLDAA